MQKSRNAIALLITLMFVMLMSVAIGYGLKQFKKSSDIVQNEQFMYQSVSVVSDIINILKNSPDVAKLKDDNSTEAMYSFLSIFSELPPFEIDGLHITLSITNAHSKLNPNLIATNPEIQNDLREYLSTYMVDYNYVDVLLDVMSSFKAKDEYNNYNSYIFDVYPNLFREYLASKEHLNKVNVFYQEEYNDKHILDVPFDKLFYYTKDINSSIDVNYATVETWKMMLNVGEERAITLHSSEGNYTSMVDLALSEEEKVHFAKYKNKTSFYEPYLMVHLTLNKASQNAYIYFEYDINAEKGFNFVFDI